MADVSKVSGYAVTGGHSDKLTAAKLVAYAVTNDADTYMSASKLVAYAVTGDTGGGTPSVVRPQVFTCT